MSEENVDFLRRLYERWGSGDFRTDSWYVDGFELVMGPDFPDHGVHSGREGVRSYMRGFLDPWERLTIEAEELSDSGETVLARVLQRGTGASSGIEIELRYFQLWTFEGSAPTRMETIMDEGEAVARMRRGQPD